MINIFNRNSILLYYVCQVIVNSYPVPPSDEIVTKEILVSENKPFKFALLSLFTCGINILTSAISNACQIHT